MNLRTILFVLLVFTNTVTADDTANYPPTNQTILVIGDSLSAAYGLELEQGWVNLLNERLDNYNQNGQWSVVNASVSGDTTAGGLARLPALLDQYRPSLCIIALGANDGLRGLSIKRMQNNLNAMAKACNENGTSIIVGMRMPPNYGDQYAREFFDVYKNVAESNQIGYVPFLLEKIALDDGYFQQDRLHPTAEAQPLILETVWPFIETLIH